MLQGMGLGLSWGDLAEMPVPMLIGLVEAHADEREKARRMESRTAGGEEAVRDATQEDMAAFI